VLATQVVSRQKTGSDGRRGVEEGIEKRKGVMHWMHRGDVGIAYRSDQGMKRAHDNRQRHREMYFMGSFELYAFE